MKSKHKSWLATVCGSLLLISLGAGATALPKPEAPFAGKIAIQGKDSTPAWPAAVTAPKGAPNIILVMTDDTGFGAASTFGGPAQTPALQQLADRGLRYNRFHTTALCSPTRASLLSGRNHHRVGFGAVTEIGNGYPGYNAQWKKSTAAVAEVLRQNGYGTGAFGKWHNTPIRDISPVGPFDRWPTGLGFDYFYGFMSGEVSQWEPPLYRNTTPVDPPPLSAKQDYHVTTDVVNDAIRWVQTQKAVAPNKPYFIYLAPGATHAPLHVAKPWVDKYRGKFDQGWDRLREETFARQKKLGVIPRNAKLTPRPKELPAWDSLSAEQKRLLSRQMEVFSAFLEQTDYEIGRLIKAAPDPDNTLVFYIVGDNGASAEGGPDGSDNYGATTFLGLPDDLQAQFKHIDELGTALHNNHFASAWAWATNAPFQWTKQVASHLGGTRDPLVVSWPARIKDQGGLRQQFTHVNDVVPTIYEAAGVEAPSSVNGVAQQAFDGTSFVYSFNDAKAKSQHRLQYFEMLGNRALYKDGWWAGARHESLPWKFAGRSEDFTQDRWELYKLDEDFSQSEDLAAKYPEKLKELQAEFDKQARANDVYPLNNGISTSIGARQPKITDGQTEFVYRGDIPRLPAFAAPDLTRSYRLTAQVQGKGAGTQGLILSVGARDGGYTLFVKDGKLIFENNFAAQKREQIVANVPLPDGKAELVYEYTRDPGKGFVGGVGRLFINGKPVGNGRLARVGPPSYQGSFDIGQVHVSPVSAAYVAPFRFNGTIDTVTVSLK